MRDSGRVVINFTSFHPENLIVKVIHRKFKLDLSIHDVNYWPDISSRKVRYAWVPAVNSDHFKAPTVYLR